MSGKSAGATVEWLVTLPVGAVVHAVHPVYQRAGVAAIREELASGELVWVTTGDERPCSSAELVAMMGGAEFRLLAPVSPAVEGAEE